MLTEGAILMEKSHLHFHMEIWKSYLQFCHPSTATVAGPTSNGRTYLVREIFRHHGDTIKRDSKSLPRTLWCYSIWQNLYREQISGVEIWYTYTLSKESELKDDKPGIIVCDDMVAGERSSVLMAKNRSRGSLAPIFIHYEEIEIGSHINLVWSRLIEISFTTRKKSWVSPNNITLLCILTDGLTLI